MSDLRGVWYAYSPLLGALILVSYFWFVAVRALFRWISRDVLVGGPVGPVARSLRYERFGGVGGVGRSEEDGGGTANITGETYTGTDHSEPSGGPVFSDIARVRRDGRGGTSGDVQSVAERHS